MVSFQPVSSYILFVSKKCAWRDDNTLEWLWLVAVAAAAAVVLQCVSSAFANSSISIAIFFFFFAFFLDKTIRAEISTINDLIKWPAIRPFKAEWKIYYSEFSTTAQQQPAAHSTLHLPPTFFCFCFWENFSATAWTKKAIAQKGNWDFVFLVAPGSHDPIDDFWSAKPLDCVINGYAYGSCIDDWTSSAVRSQHTPAHERTKPNNSKIRARTEIDESRYKSTVILNSMSIPMLILILSFSLVSKYVGLVC